MHTRRKRYASCARVRAAQHVAQGYVVTQPFPSRSHVSFPTHAHAPTHPHVTAMLAAIAPEYDTEPAVKISYGTAGFRQK